ncbi:MAG: hypothetical protein HZB76_02150 [Chlamydiae bacterium]|nr:hypothetical protein [Chlamydiota bacterium]
MSSRPLAGYQHSDLSLRTTNPKRPLAPSLEERINELHSRLHPLKPSKNLRAQKIEACVKKANELKKVKKKKKRALEASQPTKVKIPTSTAAPKTLPTLYNADIFNINQADMLPIFYNSDISGKAHDLSKINNRPREIQLLHFIWMGKPFAETKNTKNLIDWKNRFPDKQVVLWTDNTDEATKKYCRENNILMISTAAFNGKLFLNYQETRLDFNELIRIEKEERFPSQYVAISDIYRLFIMFLFSPGVYIDCDNRPTNYKTLREGKSFEDFLLKGTDIAKPHNNNDFWISKINHNLIFAHILKTIHENYNDSPAEKANIRSTKNPSQTKGWDMIRVLIQSSPYGVERLFEKFPADIKFITRFHNESFQTDLSWVCQSKRLSEMKNKVVINEAILHQVAKTLYREYLDRNILNLTKYDDLLNTKPGAREFVLQELTAIIQAHREECNHINAIYAKDQEEYDKFIPFFKSISPHSTFLAFKKALKRRSALDNFWQKPDLFQGIEKHFRPLTKIDSLSVLLKYSYKYNTLGLTEQILDKYRAENPDYNLEKEANKLRFVSDLLELKEEYRDRFYNKLVNDEWINPGPIPNSKVELQLVAQAEQSARLSRINDEVLAGLTGPAIFEEEEVIPIDQEPLLSGIFNDG